MTSVVTTLLHKVQVDDVSDVRITEIVEDGGEFARAIRVYGSPAGTEGPPIIEVVLRSGDRASIEVTTPEISF